MYNVSVKVMPKPEVLDAQGRTLIDILEDKYIKSCSIGKHISLSIESASTDEALSKADEIAKNILCNPLIENYSLFIESKDL